MWRRLISLLSKQPEKNRVLALERENQRLRLELAETLQKLATAQADLRRQQESGLAQVQDMDTEFKTRFFMDLGGVMGQFSTQIHLSEIEQKPLQVRDVLAVAKSLLRILQNWGVTFDGEIGQEIGYDPDQHDLIRSDFNPAPGEIVVVRLPGVRYKSSLVRKAGVLPVKGENNP